jgi:hypothetical protein
MGRIRRGAAVALVACAFVSCKSKTAQTPDAAPTPSPTATSPASAAPPTPPGPTSLLNFEGQINFIAQAGDIGHPTQNVVMLVKNDRIRIDTIPGTDTVKALGAKAFLLLRVAEKKLDIVSEVKQQAIELDLSDTEALKGLTKEASPGDPNAHGKASNDPPPKLSKTGKKETIAGTPCEDWEILVGKEQRRKGSFCIANLDSTFFHLSIPNIPPEYAFVQELTDGQHFPMRITSYDDRTGAESGRLEVTKFDPHPLEASKFEIPAGFTTMDMMQLLGAMSGGRGVPGMPNVPGIPSNLPNVPPRHHHH